MFTFSILVASTSAFAEKRVALVIGNGQYQYSAALPSLRNPPNDARGIAKTLKELGFDLIGGGVQLDLDKVAMENVIIEFGEQLSEGTVGLFYYAGHGLAVNKTNYLVPVDTQKMTRKTVNLRTVSAELVMQQFPKSGGMNIMILDACRNTPASLRSVRGADNEGLVQMNAPTGTLISYATQPGNVALDGKGKNSPYALALMKMMRQPGVGILEMFNDVGVEVEKNTDGFQRPWINSSPLEGQFYFKPTAPKPVGPSAEMIFWQSIQNSDDPAAFKAYIQRYPKGDFISLANVNLRYLKRAQQRKQAEDLRLSSLEQERQRQDQERLRREQERLQQEQARTEALAKERLRLEQQKITVPPIVVRPKLPVLSKQVASLPTGDFGQDGKWTWKMDYSRGTRCNDHTLSTTLENNKIKGFFEYSRRKIPLSGKIDRLGKAKITGVRRNDSLKIEGEFMGKQGNGTIKFTGTTSHGHDFFCEGTWTASWVNFN
ncbi:MAG: hypothetical protein COB59_11405 [Rhodospirillaceae bacterium]|nr:MAG: hypothetical protein COB59_11405 [Rhodospirillaceae bacterium]